MSYTKRDYNELAKSLASSLSDARHTDISAETALMNCIGDIIDTLARLNPNFDSVRFAQEIDKLAPGKTPAIQETIQ